MFPATSTHCWVTTHQNPFTLLAIRLNPPALVYSYRHPLSTHQNHIFDPLAPLSAFLTHHASVAAAPSWHFAILVNKLGKIYLSS